MSENTKQQEKEDQKRTDEEILFPEVKVDDITIRPWTFGMLFEISEPLERILDRMKEKEIDLDMESGFISYTTLARIFTIAGPEVLHIMHLTLDKDEDFVKKLSMENGIKIAMIIYQQNKETIKNALSPLLSQKKTKTGARS